MPERACSAAQQSSNEADAGSWRFRHNKKGVPISVRLACPCGCGSTVDLPCGLPGDPHGWYLEGYPERPSLYPEVVFPRADDPSLEHWRGWLLDGVWHDTRTPPALRVAN